MAAMHALQARKATESTAIPVTGVLLELRMTLVAGYPSTHVTDVKADSPTMQLQKSASHQQQSILHCQSCLPPLNLWTLLQLICKQLSIRLLIQLQKRLQMFSKRHF